MATTFKYYRNVDTGGFEGDRDVIKIVRVAEVERVFIKNCCHFTIKI